jgi:hypothetical protein
MTEADRIVAKRVLEDWKYYTLTFPVAEYAHLRRNAAIGELCRRAIATSVRCHGFWPDMEKSAASPPADGRPGRAAPCFAGTLVPPVQERPHQ